MIGHEQSRITGRRGLTGQGRCVMLLYKGSWQSKGVIMKRAVYTFMCMVCAAVFTACATTPDQRAERAAERAEGRADRHVDRQIDEGVDRMFDRIFRR